VKVGSTAGASLCEGFHEGGLEGELLYWGTQDDVFERYAKCSVKGPLSS